MTAIITIIAAIFLLVIIGSLAAESLFQPGIIPVYGWSIGAGLIALLVWQTRARDRAALRLGAPTTPLLLIMFIAFGAAVAIDVIGLALTGQFTAHPELLLVSTLGARALSVGALLPSIAFVVILQPIAEGLLFSGVTQPALRAALGGWAGLFVTALLFGVFHFLAYTPTFYFTGGVVTAPYYWHGLGAPLLAGLVFGAVRILTGSTRAAIAAQIAFGLFALLKLLVVIT